MSRAAADALLKEFAANWVARTPPRAEIDSLRAGKEGSLPHFSNNGNVTWITLAPTYEDLRATVDGLRAWVLPSYGREMSFVSPKQSTGKIAKATLLVSPAGYFKWECLEQDYENVVGKLLACRRLAGRRPERSRRERPSRYELRRRFAGALLVGDRTSAEDAIRDLDQLHLETSVNTDCMRIRMWHFFREFDKIVSYDRLPRLLTQRLPPIVVGWLAEAQRIIVPPVPQEEPAPKEAPTAPTVGIATWEEWFRAIVEEGRQDAIESFLENAPSQEPDTTTPDEARRLQGCLEDLFLRREDSPLNARRELLCQGLSDFMQSFLREPQFPRSTFGNVYLALMRLWSALRAGDGAREAGSILLELADASLRLNVSPNEVLTALKGWWDARQAPAQLPYLLDAIEILERQHPDIKAPTNLWIEAAELVRRAPDTLAPSEKDLWRRVGIRIGMDKATIEEFLPRAKAAKEHDVLKKPNVRRVAIVCMRERQASEAAAAIKERTGAEVVIVASKTAGAETARAMSADVVLFVWMASNHAVFRAFDGYDRSNFCYVQGTGSSSIVRTLERWAISAQE